MELVGFMFVGLRIICNKLSHFFNRNISLFSISKYLHISEQTLPTYTCILLSKHYQSILAYF
jgi:hypothetical protein